MEIIQNIDKQWFWLGYVVGANTRKNPAESPNRILNLGDRTKTLVPDSDKKKVSFFIGVITGRKKIVQNINTVKVYQYQDKDAHKSKGDYLTLGVGKVEGVRGQSVVVPVYIANNSVDNRGFSAFQAKINYNNSNLTLQSVTCPIQSMQFNYSAASGIIKLQGLNNEILYEDKVVAYMTFLIGQGANTTENLNLLGPTGQGSGSDIFTTIDGDLYYIQPINLESGAIILEESTGQGSSGYIVNVPSGLGDNYSSFASGYLTYDFDFNLSYIGSASGGGSGVGAGGHLIVYLTYADGTYSTLYIPVTNGSNHYSGRLPVQLPSMKSGPVSISYEFEPEDEDDLYYWFIKAGALWGFETEIPREENGADEEKAAERPKTMIERLVLHDDCILIIERPPQTDFTITEVLRLRDADILQLLMDISDLKLSEILEMTDEEILQILNDPSNQKETGTMNFGDEVILEIG